MKVINVYRDKVGELTLGCHGKYYAFPYTDIDDAPWHLSELIEDEDFYMELGEDNIEALFPNGLEAAFVTSITEEELNNVCEDGQKIKIVDGGSMGILGVDGGVYPILRVGQDEDGHPEATLEKNSWVVRQEWIEEGYAEIVTAERERALAYVRKNLLAWPEGEEEVSVYGDDGELLFEESKYDFYPEQCEFFEEDYDFTKDEVFPWEDNTGECPYEEGTLIDVVYRDERVNLGTEAMVEFSSTGSLSSMWADDWSLSGSTADIIKHRLHVPKMGEESVKVSEGPTLLEDHDWGDDFPELAKLTGGSSDYYKVEITSPTTLDEPYQAECNDIIEALDMTFAEGNAFKAIWRTAAARQGNGKPGTTAKYDAEKVVFFGKRMLVKAEEEK